LIAVEQRKQPSLRGLPTAVVQYNSYKGGGLIAVSYEARKSGVKRYLFDTTIFILNSNVCLVNLNHFSSRLFVFSSMRGDEAKEACPQIQLVQVPVARGKANLNTYRNAGSEVFLLSSGF
jgi:DNA polymerase eta